MLCLNIGVDPPDVSKPTPCARFECWTEPNVDNPSKSLQQIASALKSQYERWQPKARYKVAPDPTVAELKRVCLNLRRAAKEERVLFHYNGHGVPRPSQNGEIWVFNHNYTQYIPFNLVDLHEFLGSPSLYIFDCNSAGTIFTHFQKLLQQCDEDYEDACEKAERRLPTPQHRNSILLGACADGELLPTSSSVPADLFTACLTTPIKTALRWFVKRTLVKGVTEDMLDRIPGSLNARHTPLGELNWIFTAITDTIAWNVLPRDMFKKLYRQDLMLASLMRNFLLADRIMRFMGCRPVSHPQMPETHTHPLWQSFELSMEQLLAQLPALLAEEEARMRASRQGEAANSHMQPHHVRFTASNDEGMNDGGAYAGSMHTNYRIGSQAWETREAHHFRSSSFFEDQMKAFDVWLDMGPDERVPPEQLPIMLQVLLSPTLRIKALPMIARYLQTGPVAVDLALSVGIFPYMLRLLKSQASEIRQDLVFIWSKILALDDTCRTDLVKEKGEDYFARFLALQPERGDEPRPVYLAVAMFVLSVVAKDHAERCRAVGTLDACFSRLTHENAFVRRWACLCLTEVIRLSSFGTANEALAWTDLIYALRKCATEDEAPDVRAAATSALATIMNGVLRGASPISRETSKSSLRSDYSPASVAAEREERRSLGNTVGEPIQSPDNGLPCPIDGSESEGFRGFCCSRGLSAAEYLDAPVPTYHSDERDALLYIGKVIVHISSRECSVLVRREVSTGIAKAVRHQQDRFVRAAYGADIIGIDDKVLSCRTDIEECEAVYRQLWTVLSELSFDPHPVIAALARRSYDLVSEKLQSSSNYPRGLFIDESRTGYRASSLPESSTKREEVRGHFERGLSPIETMPMIGEGRTIFSPPQDEWRGGNPALAFQRLSPEGDFGKPLHRRQGSMIDRSSHVSSRNDSPFMHLMKKKLSASDVPQSRIRADHIHVRSTSGNFDLNPSARLPPVLSQMPRVNSASLLPEIESSSPLKANSLSKHSDELCSSHERSDCTPEEGPRSLPHTGIALAKGVGNLVKTLSQQFNLAASGGDGSPSLPSKSGTSSNEGSRDGKEDKPGWGSKPQSPRRTPRRSLSYQVLNAASSVSPRTDTPLSRNTSYLPAPAFRGFDDRHGKKSGALPHGYDGLYLSHAGDAALSLYEWSSAYMSRVEFDATTSDFIHEEESLPRYAALWNKISNSREDMSVEDSLLAMARLGEAGAIVGAEACEMAEDSNNWKSARELAVYSMGPGGGAVTAMAFLPRDGGVGDDQLLATGDSTGGVGVYDVKSGNCHGSFGVPSPPGIPEVGISSILCLNRPVSNSSENNAVRPNSLSALILAGAYDGRIAVFKSDPEGRKYRIMSTFQASGQSFWSKVGTSRENLLASSRRLPDSETSSEASSSSLNGPRHPDPTMFSQAVRDSGNGLVLSYDYKSSYLAAGGCDNEVVRVWDLSREQCIWDAPCVEEGAWPTALTMWKEVNPKVFVTGSSSGTVSIIDMRQSASACARTLGTHQQPIISVGTFSQDINSAGDVIVAADVGGDIAFWDPRFRGTSLTSMRDLNPEVSRIKAHQSNVTAMAVHPTGQYIASGSTGKCVKIFGADRVMVKMLSHHESGGGLFGSASRRIPPVMSLAFQYESSLLAVGCGDSSVMIYGNAKHF